MVSTTLAFGAIFAVLLLTLHHEAQGARIHTSLITNTNQSLIANTTQDPTTLVDSLVTKEPTVYKLSEQWTWGNHYMAKVIMSGSTMANGEESVSDFALKFEGRWTSKHFGHNSMHVIDPATGNELFKVRASRHTMNPAEWVGRFSYRILPPGSKDEKDSIFTINKDYIGRGLLGTKEEWRIYRGRQRDGELAYYCVGSYMSWDAKCYNSVRDYNTGRKGFTVWGTPDVKDLPKLTPVVKLHKKWGVGTFFGGLATLLPDAQYLSMQPNTDAALFLAFGAILDTAHDESGRGQWD